MAGDGAYYLEDIEERPLPPTLERVQFEKVLPLGAIVVMNVLCCNYFFFF